MFHKIRSSSSFAKHESEERTCRRKFIIQIALKVLNRSFCWINVYGFDFHPLTRRAHENIFSFMKLNSVDNKKSHNDCIYMQHYRKRDTKKIWSNLCAACLFHFQRPCNEYFASHSFFNTITISSAPSWWSLVLHCCRFIHRVLDILLWNYNERNSIWRIQLLSIWIIWNAILCCKLYSKNVWRWVGVEQSADVIDNISLQSN